MDRYFYLARVTIELLSPMSVASGDGGRLDMALLRDANGLPMLSGAAIKGLLRDLMMRSDEACANALFGNSRTAGRLLFSHGAVHDRKNISVCGMRDPSNIEEDEILRNLCRDAPLLRDHVRINARGAAEDTGKFDRTAVPRGARFSFEIGLWGDEGDETQFTQTVQLVWHPLFRPGGATRQGYGRVKVYQASYQSFDSVVSDQLEKLPEVRRQAWSERLTGKDVEVPNTFGDVRELTLCLTAKGLWRAGSEGDVAALHTRRGIASADNASEVDAAFTREPVILWNGHQASWHAPVPLDNHAFDHWPGRPEIGDFVLPGSSIRGALAHRALFHWNRENDGLIDADASQPCDQAELARLSQRRDGLINLFGDAKDSEDGARSPLIVEDVVFRPKHVTIAEHNSIDRFSGGVRNAVLFSEELVASEELRFRFLIDSCVGICSSAYAALAAALHDLASGRLALGAKSSGRFDGSSDEIAGFCHGGDV